jgi:hypothetical protein
MMNMKTVTIALIAAAAFAGQAQAASLKIVEVAAPPINCVFDLSCQLVVEDSLGLLVPIGDVGPGRLQTRTFTGTTGAPGAGLTEYQYRVNLSDMVAGAKPNCVTTMKIGFGPVAALPYKGASSPPAEIFVVTSGGTGSIAPASATQSGGVITFKFAQPICPGQSSLFFGLASGKPPALATALFAAAKQRKPISTPARIPAH